MNKRVILFFLIVLALVGCQNGPAAPAEMETPTEDAAPETMGSETESVATAVPTQTEATTAVDPTPTITPLPLTVEAANPILTQGDPVAAATDDLAQRVSAEPEEISLVTSYGDEFPADTLGCPSLQKETRPIPAFITGRVIVLAVAGDEHVYHAHGGRVVYCYQQQ